ncbi:hypothetical protein [Rhizobium yanglingense]
MGNAELLCDPYLALGCGLSCEQRGGNAECRAKSRAATKFDAQCRKAKCLHKYLYSAK